MLGGEVLRRATVFGTLVGLVGAAAVLVSCGAVRSSTAVPAWAATLPEGMSAAGDLMLRQGESDRPALELSFPWGNPRASLGWGGARLWARPSTDNVSVSAIFDAPSDRARWLGCEEAELEIDGRRVRVPARYVGRPMQEGGHYDAVQLDLDVLQIRKIVLGRTLGGHVCGDPFTITEAQRGALRRFVEHFDRIARPEQHGFAPFYREVGPRVHALPTENDEDEDLLAG